MKLFKKNKKKMKKRLQQGPELLRVVSRESCPSPEEISFSFDPECPLEIKSKIVDHIAICPACRREFELLGAAHRLITDLQKITAVDEPEATETERKPYSLPFPLWKLTVASISLVVILILGYTGLNYWNSLRQERKTPPVEQIILSEDITLPYPTRIKLSWNPVEGTSFYRVEVFDQYMYLLWQSSAISGTSIELPAEVVDSLRDDDYFFWQLLVYSGENLITESPVRKVHLKPQ